MKNLGQQNNSVTFELELTEKDLEEINDRCEFHEWHWNIYCYMNGSLINGISVIELKLNDFISDYFTSCDKLKSRHFIHYVMENMNLNRKLSLFNQLLTHIDIEELGEINDTDYSLLNDLEPIIKYRNMFAHSVLDQNYTKLKQLKERQRIRLQYLSGKKQSTRFVTIDEHQAIMEKLSKINLMLKEIIIDTNRKKFPEVFLDLNGIDNSQHIPRAKKNK